MTNSKQLAIDGGTPAFPDGPPTWPPQDDDVASVLAGVIEDGSWGKYHGGHCDDLRNHLADFHNCEHVTLACSGTIAVELALRGMAVGEGDEVVLAAYDFPGNFRAIESVGATPVLVDIDPATWSLDATQLERAISPTTRAVIVSHLHGGFADMAAVDKLARQHGFSVIEDACQTPGARIGGRIAGTWGDASVLSFGGSKLLTSGRGGAVFASDEQIHQRIRVFANRGNDAFPLSELQAVVLPPQLKKLEQRNRTRRARVGQLRGVLSGVDNLIGLTAGSTDDEPVYYKVAWLYRPAIEKPDRRERLIAAMSAEGIAIDAGFRGFAGRSNRRCRKVGSLEHATTAAQATILLHHPILLAEPEVIDQLGETIERVVRHLS